MKGIRIDCKTGKVEEVEEEDIITPPIPEPVSIDLEEIAELLEYAKKQKWIKEKIKNEKIMV